MKEEQQKAFDKLWKEVWPRCRRQEKKKAKQYWAKIRPELYSTIYAAVERQKKQPAWNKDDCAYIPYLWRWLREERWEDEISLPEDADADLLLEALADNTTAPPEIPKRIMARFRKMCERLRTNWPQLNHQVNADAGKAEKIRKEFLATD